MTQKINIKKLSNHYYYPVATESAGQKSKQLDSNLKQYLIQSLETNINNKLQSLGYNTDCLIAIHRINIRLTINNFNDITTTSGLSHITNEWVEAIASGFLRILTSVSQSTTEQQIVYNDLIAVFPDQASIELVYLEYLISKSALPWWTKPLLTENDNIKPAPEIITNWLLTTPTQGAILLSELTEKVGHRWLNLLNSETLYLLLYKLINQDEISSPVVEKKVEKQLSFNRVNTSSKPIRFTLKEKTWLKELNSFEQVIFLAAVFIRATQNEFSATVSYNELVWIILDEIPELANQYFELQHQPSQLLQQVRDQQAQGQQVKQKKSLPENEPTLEADTTFDNHAREDSGTDIHKNSSEVTDKKNPETMLDKTLVTENGENQKKQSTSPRSKNNKASETPTLKKQESKQPNIIPESYPTGCGGLLFLIRQAVRLLPDTAHSEANVNIMYALAILSLQDLVSLLPEARQRATWKREAYLIQAFSGLNELPVNYGLDTIEQNYVSEAKIMFDKLLPHISNEINHGKNGVNYFFIEQVPHELTPLQNMLLRPGRILVNDVYITLQMPISDIDIALRKQGWDIDPGWIPQVNRVIRFEYSE